jgi:hypothetical protein
MGSMSMGGDDFCALRSDPPRHLFGVARAKRPFLGARPLARAWPRDLNAGIRSPTRNGGTSMCRDPLVSAAGATVFRLWNEADAAADHTLLPAESLDHPDFVEAMVQILAAVNACAVAGGVRG